MSISSLSKRNANVNVNADADAVGKVGSNNLEFCGLWWKGWMDEMETEGYNIFWS